MIVSLSQHWFCTFCAKQTTMKLWYKIYGFIYKNRDDLSFCLSPTIHPVRSHLPLPVVLRILCNWE